MADLTVRLNLNTEDVELVVEDKVVDTVGTEVVASWVAAINDKHGVGEVKEEPKVQEPEPVSAPTESVENNSTEVVDEANKE